MTEDCRHPIELSCDYCSAQRNALRDILEWSTQEHVLRFDDGDVQLSEFVSAALQAPMPMHVTWEAYSKLVHENDALRAEVERLKADYDFLLRSDGPNAQSLEDAYDKGHAAGWAEAIEATVVAVIATGEWQNNWAITEAIRALKPKGGGG